ncbi:MAG: NADH-quinone oxidoreductase subunit L [Rickettsiaceae bacterium]|nr:NADH-quinone oxidoreductase subunit L [Rickettsiaceae bacterium]
MLYFLPIFIIFLPLIASIINGIYCKKISNCLASKISSFAIIISAILAAIIFVHSGIDKNTIHIILANWITIDSFNISWSIYVDQLTAIMLVVVTFVSAVVHIYSIGYMADDDNLPKFLSFLSLFTFFMLMLITADNFLQLFCGWEGVGLCSYLLIGYYFHKNSANNAAIKAFVVNRVGDFAFIIGIVIIALNIGSITFETVFDQVNVLTNQFIYFFDYEFTMLDVVCLLLFIGCMGKSAQIGLHVWLPDAMEGPTPVSALIHAATMVTAGVFLVVRCSFMFEYSQVVLTLITIIGAITCLFAALVAISQTDIKRVIAYSTCSQLGYMFFACGVSAYQAAIFHLATHGFFKALLFLSAGSVIHACHSQELHEMGGLRRKLPITYANFWIGSLAIIGIYPFAGFYSKDLILESAYGTSSAGNFAFILGIIAAILTAIYSLKIIILAFHGKTKLKDKDFSHAHESPAIMNIPLIILTAGALFSGMFGYYILDIGNSFGYFAGSIFNLDTPEHEHHLEPIIKYLPLIVGIAGSLIGIIAFKTTIYNWLATNFKFIYNILKNKFYFDELYDKIFVCPTKILSNFSAIFDNKFIDRFGPNGFSKITNGFSWCMCQVQTGYIFNYAFYIIMAIIFCITIFIVKYLPILWSA